MVHLLINKKFPFDLLSNINEALRGVTHVQTRTDGIP